MAAHSPARVTRRQRAQLLRGVYVIVNEGARVIELGCAALHAGVRILQYRAKRGIVAENVRFLRALTREHDALLLMNDEWRAAQEFDCDGVHLGPDDDGFERIAPVRAALRERLIGLSCGTIEEVQAANTADIDYLGAGCVYATTSKSDAGIPIGPAGLRALVEVSALPVAGVGGVSLATLAEVQRTGAAMAAVISAIEGAAHPQCVARELVDAWER